MERQMDEYTYGCFKCRTSVGPWNKIVKSYFY